MKSNNPIRRQTWGIGEKGKGERGKTENLDFLFASLIAELLNTFIVLPLYPFRLFPRCSLEGLRKSEMQLRSLQTINCRRAVEVVGVAAGAALGN
jgi:hypothetical protein